MDAGDFVFSPFGRKNYNKSCRMFLELCIKSIRLSRNEMPLWNERCGMLIDERRAMKQNILARIRLTPGKIALSAVTVIFMLLLTFFCVGGNKETDYLSGLNGIERYPAVAAPIVKSDNDSAACGLSVLCPHENLSEDGTSRT